MPPVRSPLGLGPLLALAAAVGCGGAGPARAPEHAPNVLLITIDTLRADHLGIYAYGKPTSPHLDSFAASAVVFENAEASAPWTLPALASLMTSEAVSTHNCWDYGSVLDDSFTTLAERLLASGYDTACVVSHLFTTSRHGLQQGFVHSDDSYAYPEVDPAENITSQVISDKGIRFLDQKKASPDKVPWLLWLHYFDPHDEYMDHPGLSAAFVTPGERSPGQVFGDAYDGEVCYTDQHIGRVLSRLAEDGFDADTVVVVLADHGEEFFEHGARGHGHSLFGELLHVPLVLRAPGIAPRRVRDVARQVDVLPTLLELIGLPLPAGIAGRSLLPALRGQASDETPALAELEQGPYQMDSLRRGRFKLIRLSAEGRSVLFDLESDPGETADVAAQHADVVAELTKELERQKQVARERARLFGAARELTLTPGIQDELGKLGYGAAGKSGGPSGVGER